jgi:hypothetical protein
MELCAALQPSLHVFEITLRNAIFNASVRLVDATRLHMPDVPCWLDAHGSSLLYQNKFAEVQRAKSYLDDDPRRRTPGHLVAKLSFGFWVQLTARAYNELREDGPKLWPRGLPHVFPFKWPPGSKKTVPTHGDRQMIFERLQKIRILRNRIAHHEPVWELGLGTEYARLLETLGWMSSRMERAVRALDRFPAVLADGPQSHRQNAEFLLRGMPAADPRRSQRAA